MRLINNFPIITFTKSFIQYFLGYKYNDTSKNPDKNSKWKLRDLYLSIIFGGSISAQCSLRKKYYWAMFVERERDLDL